MISIIIPTYNEADQIVDTIQQIRKNAGNVDYQILVVDGKSCDETVALAESENVKVVICDKKGRAYQMNRGAKASNAEILFFMHADSVPPKNFLELIENSVRESYKSGCFKLKFDQNHWFLKANSWFTRFNLNAIRFGDQGLFVSREIFNRTGGFDENLMIMEDQEIIHRIKKQTAFKILDSEIITSARKYRDNGIYKTQFVFYLIWTMFYMGFSQQKLLKTYRKLILKNKI
ncbi:MAG: TIGR04283 family arsenosugar biosynthesis glycosyltransferase [Daejeonella sp.]